MNAETNFIRQYMNQNLELGKSHNDIIRELGISRSKYFRTVRKIQKEYEAVWDNIIMDSAKFRAESSRDRCLNTHIIIIINTNTQSSNSPFLTELES